MISRVDITYSISRVDIIFKLMQLRRHLMPMRMN